MLTVKQFTHEFKQFTNKNLFQNCFDLHNKLYSFGCLKWIYATIYYEMEHKYIVFEN